MILLTLADLQASDSGLYTCAASSESGETTWSASLTVDQSSQDVHLHKAPDPSKLPPPPSKPYAVNVTNSSVTISWALHHTSDSIGCTVECFSSSLQTGWMIVAHRIFNNTVTVSITSCFKSSYRYMRCAKISTFKIHRSFLFSACFFWFRVLLFQIRHEKKPSFCKTFRFLWDSMVLQNGDFVSHWVWKNKKWNKKKRAEKWEITRRFFSRKILFNTNWAIHRKRTNFYQEFREVFSVQIWVKIENVIQSFIFLDF